VSELVLEDTIPTIIIVENSTPQIAIIEKQSEKVIITSGQPSTINIDTSTLAKESKQDAGNLSLSSIDIKLDNQSTDALQTVGNSLLSSIDSKLTSPITTNGLTDSQLRASAISINASSLPLPTNASTSNLQTIANNSLSSIDSKLTSPIATSVNNFPSTQAISAISLPLPLDASKESKQDTGNNSLSSIDTKLTNNATTTLQTTANSSLSSIDSKIPVNGIANNANSFPVVISSEQSQDTFITGQGGQSAINNNIFLSSAGSGSIDTFSNGITYRAFYCQITASAGISTGNIVFEGSNNNINFTILTWFDDSVVTGTPFTAATAIAANANRFFSGKTSYRYVRCRISTGFVGGTIQAITRFSTTEYRPRIAPVNQTIGGNFSTSINSSLPSGVNAIGDVGVQYRANATGAASRFHLVTTTSTNAAIVKASTGRLIGWCVANTTAGFLYLKFHNQNTLPTAGTGVVMALCVPPNSLAQLTLAGGIGFSAGIGITTINGAADATNNGINAHDLMIELFYQ
jgi:hypothetical protein